MRLVAFDVESSGTLPEFSLQPWRMRQGKAWLTSLAWVWREDGATHHSGGLLQGRDVASCNTMIRELLGWAAETSHILVGWNVVFDIAWLYAYAENDPGLLKLLDRARFLDAMLLWRHLDIEPEYAHKHGRSYSLKAAVPIFFPQHKGYEAEIDYHGTDPQKLAELHEYNIKDCYFTLRLAKRFWESLNHSQQVVAIIEASSFKMIARANLEGLIVDTLEAGNLSACLKQTATAKLAKLAECGITQKIVRSPKQLGQVLYDQWNLPVLAQTSTGARSTDKAVLHKLALRDRRVRDIKQYREALNNDTKFAVAPLASVAYNGDGRTHPQARVFGTYTGRLTFSSKQSKGKSARQIGFALHQMKRDPAFRRIIVPPPGHVLMEFDATGQEYRWMAVASGDVTMLELCQPGQDPHAYMGSRISGIPYSQIRELAKVSGSSAANARQCGKVVNLCVGDVPVLTDRGYVYITEITTADLVWDGVEFVAHDGVVCSGMRHVITHDGVTATSEHRVLIDENWEALEDAAKNGWCIQTTGRGWSAIWIVDGILRRVVREKQCAIRASTVQLWTRTKSQLTIFGDWAIDTMQAMRGAAASSVHLTSGQVATETSQRLVSTVQQPKVSIVSQLRRTWDRMQVRLSSRSRRMDQDQLATSDIQEPGYRTREQRWSLRAWEPAADFAQGEPVEPPQSQSSDVARQAHSDEQMGKSIFAHLYYALCGDGAFWRRDYHARVQGGHRQTQELAQDSEQAPVYDIVNCGPRKRFTVNGRIVHNSSQYRVGFKRLQQIAEVDYGITMSLDEAQRIQKVYLSTYPGISRYWTKQILTARANGYVETIPGRRVRIRGQWGGEMGWQMEGTAINYCIQGTGAEQKYLALRCIRDCVDELGMRFAWDLHDGLYFYVPVNRVEEAACRIKDLLDNLPYEAMWKFKLPIAMPWDCKVGPSWGDLKPFEFK